MSQATSMLERRNSWLYEVHSNNEQCEVCLWPIEDVTAIYHKSHAMHLKCVQKCLIEKPNCPECGERVSVRQDPNGNFMAIPQRSKPPITNGFPEQELHAGFREPIIDIGEQPEMGWEEPGPLTLYQKVSSIYLRTTGNIERINIWLVRKLCSMIFNLLFSVLMLLISPCILYSYCKS